MIGAHQNLGPPLGRLIGLLNRGRQCVDIIGAIKVGADSPRGRLPSLLDQTSEKFIIGCGGGGAGKLLIELEEQDFLTSGIDHFLHD